MARKVQVTLVDDLDGGQADETVAFEFDGTAYEIDLSTKNAEKLRKAVGSYINVARKVGRTGSKRFRSSAAGVSTADREHNQVIRKWAKAQGLKVSDRGRISADVVEQYKTTH